MERLAANVLVAFALCALAVTLAVLLVPSVSLAAVLEWLTTTPPCGGTPA
jgi:hypothetical protein